MVVASRAGRLAAFSLFLWGFLAFAPAGAARDIELVSGSTFGEQVDTFDGTVTSGPLPTATLPNRGGARVPASLGSVCVPTGACSILRTGALGAITQGVASGDGQVRGSAMVARANVGGVVTADVIQSLCTAGASGLVGASALTDVRVGGKPVAASPARNTVIHVK